LLKVMAALVRYVCDFHHQPAALRQTWTTHSKS
jgi:hypothetical protein